MIGIAKGFIGEGGGVGDGATGDGDGWAGEGDGAAGEGERGGSGVPASGI